MNAVDDITANDVLAFLVELLVFVSLGVWAWRQGESALGRCAWVVLAVGVAALLWGLFVAPNAPVHVLALEVILRLAILTAGVAAFATLVRPAIWIPVAAIVVVNTVLLYVGPFHR
ncbi:YrdB family protein [Gordonia caeni]|uniref:DUF2568 domain-containing protein n=1 Tax=Gordonia caeni TaxID=1007097 RepID=A0ABP7NR50_9ACTN